MPLADVLRAQMGRQPRYSPGLVSRLSGVPKATIVNWLEGRVVRPRRWQDLVRVADAMRLGRDETEDLLAAARHPSLTELARVADDGERALLRPWWPSTSFDLPVSVPLPSLATPLVGRTVEQAALSALVCDADVRVVTLTGAAGAGKTRLAIAVASAVSDAFRDGVVYVALAPLTDAGLVPELIMRALGLSGTDTAIRAALAERHQLVVIDNFEHLLDALPAVAELVAGAPGLTLLFTSRTVLHLYGEHRFEVDPLPVPRGGNGDESFEQVAASPAVVLFTQRARAADPSFQLDAANIGVVAEICRRLDGLPLAIELAAARMTVLKPAGLLTRLARNVGLLTSGARDLPARHQSLQATLDWSLNQLSDPSRRLFAHLSVYMSGCRLDGAEAVAQSLKSNEVLDALMALVDHSLLRTHTIHDGTRFVMLETVRSYAESLLTETESDLVHRGAVRHIVDIASAVEREAHGPRQVEWLNRADEELHNIRALLRWSFDHDEATAASTIAASLLPFWLRRSPLPEAEHWLGLALRHANGLPLPVLAATLYAAGRVARQRGDTTAAEHRLRKCLRLVERLHDDIGRARALSGLGVVAYDRGDLDGSSKFHREALDIYRQRGDDAGTAVALTNLGEVARRQGDLQHAVTLQNRSASLFSAAGDDIGRAAAFTNLAASWMELGSPQKAHAALARAAVLWRRVGDRSDLAECLELFAALAALGQQPARGIRLAGAAACLREAGGKNPSPAEGERHQAHVTALRQAVSAAQFTAAWRDGWAMDADRAVDLALDEDSDPYV